MSGIQFALKSGRPAPIPPAAGRVFAGIAMAQILIADDEEGFRFLLKRMLETSGHEVREAADGDAAIAALRTFPAQVAIVDLFMPGREGIETIMEIRRRHPDTKIIAISGGAPKTGSSFLGMAQKLGAHRALNKPFSADELLVLVSHLIEPDTP
ncbi:MAG: response regulator receiver [Limisphaerales bacterium]|nr:MAG: response regulator receiver [Limisphaerales bacterium]KAG0507671.1 MAG: response regulator receiver [Limisphaerales bacterium]TXT51790.1 MAG: response regulator receiver [Limisphaerales bacterium]